MPSHGDEAINGLMHFSESVSITMNHVLMNARHIMVRPSKDIRFMSLKMCSAGPEFFYACIVLFIDIGTLMQMSAVATRNSILCNLGLSNTIVL